MKLTPEMLRRLVKEEMKKIQEGFGKVKDVESSKAKETDADEYAEALEKKFNFYKALGLEESRLTSRLKKIQEQRRSLAKDLKKDA